MRMFTKKVSKTAGLVPGTVIHIGDKKTERTRITVLDYDENRFKEKDITEVECCYECKDTNTVSWINIDGIHDTFIIEGIGKRFNLHPLVLEDITNTEQRPKYEDFGDYLFVSLKMLRLLNNNYDEVAYEQVSVIIGPNYVISFQETQGDVFDAVRERIRNAKGRIRKMGADYLAYALLDAVVDNYFTIIENKGNLVEDMEEELIKNPTPKTLQRIHRLKTEMIFLRKSVWPLREVVNALTRGESKLIKKSTLTYLRDIYDHTIQVIDAIEAFRDMVSGMLDIYLSSASNRMNEIMKVLTIFAAIFIPLTFIAGIYGMNFEFMPELKMRYGYFAALGFMTAVAVGMLGYFKIKKWF